MKVKKNFLPKEKIFDRTNISREYEYVWRGSKKFSLQLDLENVTVKIYATLFGKGATGSAWVDMTSYFTGNSTITSDTMLLQPNDTKVAFWKVVYSNTSATNHIKGHLLIYK